MNMGLKDKKNKRKLSKTFSYAIHGIFHGLHKERNFRIHIIAATFAITCGIVLNISSIEWLFIILSIFGVFTLEFINSAIERVVDLITQDYHPLAMQAKDLAAGAVLVYSIMTLIIGGIIFIPKITHLIYVYIN